MATIQFDFDSIKNRIKENLQNKSEWADFLSYGVADNIIDPIAQEMAYQMQYNEYLTIENMWKKARNKSSLLVQSPIHGYIVPRKIGAVGKVRISTNKNFDGVYAKGENISIDKFFMFSGNSIFVATSKEVTLLSTDKYVDVEVTQGVAKSVKFNAMGEQYETKLVEDDSVENKLYEVFVNGIKWERVDTLFDYDSTSKVYELITNPDFRGVTLRFGNGVFGQKLNFGDTVEFKYISTLGAEGNIYSANIIKDVESQGFDVKGNPVKLYVTNIGTILGGKDYPSIEEIREVSPRVYQTGDRASSRDDYKTIIGNLSYISKVNVWGAYETLKDRGSNLWEFIPTEENVVHLALLDYTYENLTDDEKTQVIEDIYRKNDPTDLITFEEVKKLELIFNIDAIATNSSFTLQQVRTNIENALRKEYSIENIDFNTNIYNSDFVSLVDGVDGVRNHNSQILIKVDNLKFSTPYALSTKLPYSPIDYSKTKFYIRDTTLEEEVWNEFATVDSNGYLVPINIEDYDLTGSSLNFSTGDLLVNINRGLEGNYRDYEIKCIFGSATKDLILKNRQDIFMYDSAEIKVSYPIS